LHDLELLIARDLIRHVSILHLNENRIGQGSPVRLYRRSIRIVSLRLGP
jgi:hypothetical protein